MQQLLRAVVFRSSSPILIADDDLRYHDASVGAAKLLGLSREDLVGRRLSDFAGSALNAADWLEQPPFPKGEQEGLLHLLDSNGAPREVEYTAKGNVVPVRHVFALRDKSLPEKPDQRLPWVQDYAVYLLDASGIIAAWYAGAVRTYGYSAEEASVRHISFLYQEEPAVLRARLDEELSRTVAAGHTCTEGWQVRKDGSRFWANSITMVLKDEIGQLRGFARVVRDFSERHDRNEALRRKRARIRPIFSESAVAGIASGEFDHVPDVNDTFLEVVGYTREDVAANRMYWPDLTPAEYAPLDELAHEEILRYGACTPYEKELLRKDGVRVPVLVTTAALKLSPFRWISFIQDLRERNRFENIDNESIELTQDFGEIVGDSTALRHVQQQVEVVSPTDATVLILGETGTGKELVARAIHRMSSRRNLPFITLNCAAIPTGLLESELFGYERGAFTGALSQKIGRFEMAHRGTLFLDEVGDIPLDLQPKLLRALQEKSFERLGGTRTIPIDVRLVAATNRDLSEMMGDKLFRSDLYYRLKVFPITTPSLRDRPEDIPILARHFARKYAAKMGRHIDNIPSDIMRALVEWRWPGNVRELENFIERSVILSVGPSLRAPVNEIRDAAPERQRSSTLEQVEREHILRILRETNGVVTAAATRLGLPRTTLNAMMRKLCISRKNL
ncbi:MAG TPA: sigma 54-interacting transcriptional regulator [Bryobacteraceae bacterium]|nr:sigma 54-interacting transcriptional regulator [Bryobacteraceae bacterium]